MPDDMKKRLKTAGAILATTAAYFCAGKFGLSLAFMHPSASAVWPASGIALALLLLWGRWLWPGVFLGAFLVNVTTVASVPTSLAIAAGNTLEALLGLWWVNRLAGGVKFFRRARNVLRFILLAGVLSTTVAATCGLVSLILGGFAEPSAYAEIWFTWWLGDMVGDLIVAPLLIIWVIQPLPALKPKRVLEAAALLLTLLLVSQTIFLRNIPSGLEYLALPVLLWAGFRFGERGAVTSAFLMSSIALLGTMENQGPFITASPNSSLILLQAFMGTLTVTALVLASMLSEQEQAEHRLVIQDAVSRILAESPTLRQATPKILEALGERAGWNVGSIWNIEQTTQELVCVDVWHSDSARVPDFSSVTRQSRLTTGVGLPGRVWSSREPVWIPDITTEDNFPRGSTAAAEGLHAAFGFPIKLGSNILGVVEFFSWEVRQPDDHFLRMVGHIGEQLGQFVERKRAEEARRDNENRLRLALEGGKMGAWEWNIVKNRVTWSPGLEAIHGLAPGTFGGTFEDFKRDIHPEDSQTVLMQIEKTLAHRSDYHVTYRIVRPSGDVRWLEAFGRMFFGGAGAPERLLGVCMDVTERKSAEESLRAKEEQVRLITDHAPAMLAQVDCNERYRFVNQAYAKRFGLASEQIVGRSVREILGEQAYQLIRPHLQRVRQGELVDYEIEIPYERIGRRFVRVGHVPERDTHGKVIGWVSAISDMTARKRAEEALQQAKDALAKANEDLERRVEERTVELARTNVALLREMEEEKRLQEQLRQAQKMETIGTLAGGIAHDFNNILNIIKGYVTLLGEDRPEDQELVKITRVVDDAVDRGASIVQQLLTIARRTESKFEPVQLNALLKQLKELLAGIFPKTIDIGLHLDSALPPVNADANQINQVLLNICLNARDAMPGGGKLLLTTQTVSRDELRDRFQEAKDEQYARICVSDTGLGINETVKDRIFEPFFTTKQPSRGTGLGLSVVYGIVTNHRGFIEVASQPNHGTTFLIYLPLAQPGSFVRDRAESLGENKLGSFSAEGHTILFVEDETQQLELMRRFLESEGYQVLPAADGAVAVDHFLKHKDEISVVVLDLGLPVLNGWDAFQKMKQVDPGLQPIVATGYVPSEIESALARGELSAIIIKPYRLDEVLEKINLAAAKVARTARTPYESLLPREGVK
jgi:PAS domain S-box-containing protein